MSDPLPNDEDGEAELSQLPPGLADFLIAEFESTRDMRNALNTLVASEINIFVAMVTVTFVALAFVSDSFNDKDRFLLIAIWALIPVLFLGWAIFDRVARSRIQVVEYARVLNRTRRFFVERFPETRRYVSSNIYDNQPDFGAVGRKRPRLGGALLGNTGMIAILNSATFGAIIGSLAHLAGGIERDVWMTLIVLAAFAGSIAFHGNSLQKRFDKAEEGWDSFHPKPW